MDSLQLVTMQQRQSCYHLFVISSIVFWYEILSWFAFGTHLKCLIQGMVQLECQEKREGLEIEMPIRFLWAALEREGMYTA